VTTLAEKISRARSVAVVDPGRTKVGEMSALRSLLKQHGAEIVVAKKTLFRIAAKQAGLPEVAEGSFPGQAAFVMSFQDEVAGPKTVAAFQQSHPQIAFLGGMVAGKVQGREEIISLSHMLSRPEALARFAGLLRSPLAAFASLCRGPLVGFARGLQEVAKRAPAPVS